MLSRRPAFAIGLVFAATAGCGSGAPASPRDTTAPEIRDVRGTLGTGTLDLASADDTRVIAAPTPLTLQVFATDDVTPTASLGVRAVGKDGEAIADQQATLHNGLWNVAMTASPGESIRVEVGDQAGNRTLWPHAAVFPTAAEALIRTWTLLVYNATGTVATRPHLTFDAATWCQEDDAAGGGPHGGTWSVDGAGRLTLDTRHALPCDTSDFGAEWDSIESTRTAAFFVDDTYFSDRPFTRPDSATDVAGTWTRQADVTVAGHTHTTVATLKLASDGTFEDDREDGRRDEGTWQVQHNSDYTNDFGQLLVLSTTRVDGADVTPTTTVHYWTIRDGKLLVDPFVEIL